MRILLDSFRSQWLLMWPSIRSWNLFSLSLLFLSDLDDVRTFVIEISFSNMDSSYKEFKVITVSNSIWKGQGRPWIGAAVKLYEQFAGCEKCCPPHLRWQRDASCTGAVSSTISNGLVDAWVRVLRASSTSIAPLLRHYVVKILRTLASTTIRSGWEIVDRLEDLASGGTSSHLSTVRWLHSFLF